MQLTQAREALGQCFADQLINMNVAVKFTRKLREKLSELVQLSFAGRNLRALSNYSYAVKLAIVYFYFSLRLK